jgi:SAM-dependent methyltransferase
MKHVEYASLSFPEDAFSGTAAYYAKYRVPYPTKLFDDLLLRAGIKGDGKLLDLACGPGRVTIPLAPSFHRVLAIDLEREMIEEGQRAAEERGVANIDWTVGRAEDLKVESESIQLITIGEAFHRLDQKVITERACQWLSPGSCLITMGCSNMLSGTEGWQHIVREIAGKWVPRDAARSKGSSRKMHGAIQNELVLKDSGFVEVANYTFDHSQDWSVESIIGFLYSTSFCSQNVLGENVEAFEADIGNALNAYDPNGHYREDIRFGYTLGRKPPMQCA